MVLPLLAMWISEDWALCAARWAHRTDPVIMRRVLHARTRAVVVHDRVLNGRVP